MFGQSKWGYNAMDIRNKKWMNTAVNKKKELSYVDLYHLSKWDTIF